MLKNHLFLKICFSSIRTKTAMSYLTTKKTAQRRKSAKHSRSFHIDSERIYETIDQTSGILIYTSIIFGPWAFGSVHPWSIWTLNYIGYALGLLLLSKKLLRSRLFHKHTQRPDTQVLSKEEFGTKVLAGLSTLIILYILVHAINSAAVFNENTLVFDYSKSYIHWLPHSFDASKTWQIFWQYLSLYFAFWAIREWLIEDETGKFTPSAKARFAAYSATGKEPSILFRKTKKLLYLITFNGSLIALVGILQKFEGSQKLLWIYEPTMLKAAIQHFGPFAYRGNGAAYINIVLPLGLYLFLKLKSSDLPSPQRYRIGSGPRVLFLPVLLFLFVAPILSNSRGGFIVLGLLTMILLFVFLKKSRKKLLFLSVSGMTLAIVFFGALNLGGDETISRLRDTLKYGLGNSKATRFDIYQHFPAMIRDSPTWGTGPGTFSSVYQVHRGPTINVRGWKSEDMHQNDRIVSWSAWAHSDPLEFLITFGWFGTSLLILTLITVLTVPLLQRQTTYPAPYIYLYYSALTGALLHSCVDFPFQVYSILHLFVVTSCLLTTAKTNLTRSKQQFSI
jgi:hypothetical protein